MGQVLSCTGTLATILGSDQPFRYRGYVYDTEMGWYYLQSRYYDPSIGRFISADVLLSTGQGVIGNNSYAYCGNNPVTRTDAFGYSWQNNTGRWITPPSIPPLLPSRETIGVCAGLLTQAATDAWNWTAQAATDAWNWMNDIDNSLLVASIAVGTLSLILTVVGITLTLTGVGAPIGLTLVSGAVSVISYGITIWQSARMIMQEEK